MSTHARPLAVWLAAASDSQLATLFEARRVRPEASWADFFDAAEALLDPASIERMLPQLTRAEATALRRAADNAAADNAAADSAGVDNAAAEKKKTRVQMSSPTKAVLLPRSSSWHFFAQTAPHHPRSPMR
ncbi:hypothetical protein [Microbacterium sp. CH12i]|uniref:hypothetical protein n=1 Tax=Microbacterium sp. CH12i TaxID=1479651 RepID=UPI00068E6317|nr:hypothetical protein [Microbacterium sp. CH12i]